MYILLLSWLTYYPVQLALENWYVVIISSATLLLSSYGLLGCMFGPKLYVVLLHPERNTRETVQSNISNYTFSASSGSNVHERKTILEEKWQLYNKATELRHSQFWWRHEDAKVRLGGDFFYNCRCFNCVMLWPLLKFLWKDEYEPKPLRVEAFLNREKKITPLWKISENVWIRPRWLHWAACFVNLS